jgi:hypothetical protein
LRVFAYTFRETAQKGNSASYSVIHYNPLLQVTLAVDTINYVLRKAKRKVEKLMRIEKRFFVQKWDQGLLQKAVDYWTKRGIVFEKREENALFGKRGSIFGNLFSYDMSDLISQLYISVSSNNELTCLLDVNTFMQWITERNIEYWFLEVDMFESYLLHNDEQIEEWNDFRKRNILGSIIWTFTFGLFGDGVSAKKKK